MRTLTILLTAMPLAVSTAQEGTDAYIELFRSDLRADKQAIVTYAMELTDADSELFWPIYRAYETERIALGDRTLELIRKYPDVVNVTGPDTIRTLVADWFKLQDDRTKLMKKYYQEVEKKISPRVAARWMQVEHRLWLLMSLQIASEVPLIEPLRK
jgi:hypothetical protein